MSSTNKDPEGLFGTIKVGFGAGLVAGCALFSSFLSIDQQINIPHGTFYKTIGIPMGLEGMTAIGIGFSMHIIVAALIGICFNLSASYWRTFQIVTVPKGILTGAITGAIVFSLAFLPLHTLVMVPMLESEVNSAESLLSITPEEKESLSELLVNNNFVLWYSAFLHVLFGSVMGLMSGFLLHDRYRNVERIHSFW
ncbi:MAG: hypothetical protein CK526_04970 [Thaumarchaeota archaeon]|nr:hypothetical protein [Nitrosopumilus sp.]PHY03948.1 MAG: hypothetical protein CK526_04970 [Nitrososphaerota archaeon]